ncbi:MAG: hypothetical protein Q9195_007652 [Heterodermia aff. obscurata]
MSVGVARKFILLILITPFLSSANFSRAASFIPNRANLSNSTHASIYTPLNLSLGTIKPATRQLIEHDAFMHIFYEDRYRLQAPYYRYVLQVAILRIIQKIELNGDDALVTEQFMQIEGNVLLIADHVPHSPTRELTWGILGEAVAILQDFMRQRPFLLQADLFEGLDGRGIPIGKISVGPYPIPNMQSGDVQAS